MPEGALPTADIMIKIYYDRSKLYVSQKVYSGDMCFCYDSLDMSSDIGGKSIDAADK